MSAVKTRKEHDFIGDLEIPDKNYYGVQTYRAIDNFNITGIPMSSEPDFIQAFAWVKKAAAKANRDCGALDAEICEAICWGCDQLLTGKYDDQFVTDFIQGGAGTSVNMNFNEVIANLALEHLGHKKGEYKYVHPNNHVNCSQSTNDSYPTAFKIALYLKLNDLIEAYQRLQESFAKKRDEFKNVLKMGRTQLQDAVPMTLGAEFGGYAATIGKDVKALKETQQLALVVNMSATAIGTKVNTPQGYSGKVIEYLRKETGLEITLADNLIEATYDNGEFVQIMGTVKRAAVKLSKICNDLRLMGSGPRTGLNEINLPKMQPGSSIMPGKVNPVIPEVVNQTCFFVIGQDLTVTLAAEAGQLELNVMEPVLTFAMFKSITYMTNAVDTLIERCINGITANEEHCNNMVMNSVGIVTLLNPILGYDVCSKVAGEALNTGKSVHDIVVKEKKLISQEKWEEIYSKENLITPRFIKK